MLELLNQLDGFEPTQSIKVIMATNRIDILDPGLLRPGRIDRKVEFPAPNEASREHILKIHSRKMNLMRGIDLHKIATLLPTADAAKGAEVFKKCASCHTVTQGGAAGVNIDCDATKPGTVAKLLGLASGGWNDIGLNGAGQLEWAGTGMCLDGGEGPAIPPCGAGEATAPQQITVQPCAAAATTGWTRVPA
jgi:hypothetical protein